MDSRPRFYTDQDVEAILSLALKRAPSGGMGREQLLQMAAELGIDEQAVAEAEREYLVMKVEAEERRLYDKETKHGFYVHLFWYLAIAGGITAFRSINSGQFEWSWMFLIWLVFLVIHGFEAFNRNCSEYIEGFRKWRIKRRRQQRKHAMELEQLNKELPPLLAEERLDLKA